jgi:hypothetical protein
MERNAKERRAMLSAGLRAEEAFRREAEIFLFVKRFRSLPIILFFSGISLLLLLGCNSRFPSEMQRRFSFIFLLFPSLLHNE